MTVKIEMLDDEGNVTGEYETTHVCTGDPQECPQGAVPCMDCGESATPANPVYLWMSDTGLDYYVCRRDLSGDAYARLKA